MVQNLTISTYCIGRRPCLHECTITLCDGRKKSVTLGKSDISSLIETIAKEKISCDEDLKHYDCSYFKKENAGTILTKFFK